MLVKRSLTSPNPHKTRSVSFKCLAKFVLLLASIATTLLNFGKYAYLSTSPGRLPHKRNASIRLLLLFVTISTRSAHEDSSPAAALDCFERQVAFTCSGAVISTPSHPS